MTLALESASIDDVDRRSVAPPTWCLVLMGASGFAGLGYQIVWTQQLSLSLGHESAAVLAVVAAFFGGLSAGAWLAGPAVERSADPVRWYAGCELLIGAWSALLFVSMAPLGAWLLASTGPQPTPAWQWTVAFAGTFIVLLPATMAMGATLPAMERVTASMSRQGRSLAAHYASNTLGAVAGVLVATFWLVPDWGLSRTAATCVVLNVLCAVLALRVLSRPSAPVVVASSRDTSRVRWQLACTGFLGIGYEVLVVRALSEVTENTVYTFAMLLAVYLVGTALGAAAWQRWRATRRYEARVDDRLILSVAAACLVGAGCLWTAESMRDIVVAGLRTGMPAALTAEAVLALVCFGLPTFAMGALFSELSARANDAGLSFGRSLAINTMGAAMAPIVFGVVLVPVVGLKTALLVVCLGYAALLSSASWRRPMPWILTALVVVAMGFAPPIAFVDVPEGGRVISYREGSMAAVSVVEDGDGVARLRINNRQQEGSSASRLVDTRQALLPLLLHPGPRLALFLGLGTGMTAHSAADEQGLEVDAVELLPEVIAASAHFTKAFGEQAPRLHLIAADARRFVKTSDRRYDVIVADNFHPARSGSGALYTVEHFQAVRDRLASGGLFCQWLPLHQLDLDTLRSIVRTFLAVYPDGGAILASNSLETPVLGLVARDGGTRFDIDQVRGRIATIARPESPAAFGLDDELAVLGSFVAGADALARFASDAPLNTDDRPVVTYRAPRITYAPTSLPRERLVALIDALAVGPDEVTGHADARLAAYRDARRLFIAAGMRVRPSADVVAMLAQVREPLLAVLRTSPDFRPAYDPLLRMASVLAGVDRPTARALLTELVAVQPARREAGALLARLDRAVP